MNAVNHVGSHVGCIQVTGRHVAHLKKWINQTRYDLRKYRTNQHIQMSHNFRVNKENEWFASACSGCGQKHKFKDSKSAEKKTVLKCVLHVQHDFFPLLANDTIVLWRCSCRSRQRFLKKLPDGLARQVARNVACISAQPTNQREKRVSPAKRRMLALPRDWAI